MSAISRLIAFTCSLGLLAQSGAGPAGSLAYRHAGEIWVQHLPDGVRLIPIGNLDDPLRELLDPHAAGKPLRHTSRVIETLTIELGNFRSEANNPNP